MLTPETKRKLKLVPVSSSDGTIAAIMMDRNLGAYEGAFNAIPKDILTMSRNNGFHFQKWRKDPFPSSYTTQKLPSVYTFTLSADAPPKHIMNRYKPDGFHAIVPSSIGKGATSLQLPETEDGNGVRTTLFRHGALLRRFMIHVPPAGGYLRKASLRFWWIAMQLRFLKVRRMMVEYCLIMMIQATSFIYGLPDILLQ